MTSPQPSHVDHFEIAVIAVRTDGNRVPMAMPSPHIRPTCTFCGRPVVDPDGQIRATLFTREGAFGVRCELPRGCP